MELRGLRDLSEGQRYKVRGTRAVRARQRGGCSHGVLARRRLPATTLHCVEWLGGTGTGTALPRGLQLLAGHGGGTRLLRWHSRSRSSWQLPSLRSWTSVSRRISPSISPSASRAASGPCACTWWAPGPSLGCGRHWAPPTPCPGSCGRSGCCTSSRALSSPRAARGGPAPLLPLGFACVPAGEGTGLSPWQGVRMPSPGGFG